MADRDSIREALAEEASRHFGRDVAIEDLEPLQGGASRELWSFDALVAGARHELVLRRDPEGVEDAAARRREHETLVAVHAHGVPVPEPFWLHAGGRGLVMQRLRGEAIARRLLRDERYAGARRAIVGQLAAAAAALHRVPLSRLPALAVPEDPPAEAAVQGLEAELDRIGEPHPALELGLRWLRRHLPQPRRPGLVHGDLRLGNFLADESGLVGLLDWELCHAGDPVEDLGWLCIRSWRFGSDGLPAAGMGSRDDLLEAYSAAGGAAVDREELRFWEVLGNVRWGVICLVQADVHLSGAQRSLERAAIGRRTCEPEWDLLAMIA